MDGPAFVGRGARIDRRRQQRVREPDMSGTDLDDAGPFGRRKGIARSQIQPGCGRDQVRRGLGGRRRDQEGQAACDRKDVDPRAEQLLEVPGDGKGGSRTHPVALERPRDLEREEGIAVRVLVDAAQEGPRPRTAQASSEHRLERPEAQRPKDDPMRADPVTAPDQGRGDRPASRRPERENEPDRLVSQTTDGERRAPKRSVGRATGRRPRPRAQARSASARAGGSKAAETAPRSSGASGSSRSSATARARRWGAGSFSASSS